MRVIRAQDEDFRDRTKQPRDTEPEFAEFVHTFDRRKGRACIIVPQRKKQPVVESVQQIIVRRHRQDERIQFAQRLTGDDFIKRIEAYFIGLFAFG